LIAHPKDLADWTLPVHGRDAYQVAVGPIHAGVIESGHFRFHVVGERILHVDVRLFYKHRGLERAAEGSTASDGLAYAQRACGACAVSNSVAYAQACEAALGLTPPPELARARTLLLELERLYNHLNDIGAACAGVGFAPGAMVFAALKERAQRLNLLLTGHRFLFAAVAVGRSDLALGKHEASSSRRELAALGDDARTAWHEVLFNASVQDRFVGVGALSRDDALRLGTVGPVARASGVARDARLRDDGRLRYADFAPAALRRPTGDVSSRVNQRALEVDATLAMLDDLLARPLEPAAAAPGTPGGALGVGLVESPRGETACLVEMSAGRLTRFHLRTSSFANWPALAHAAAGQLFPDFPLINKSFELCYACTDR
jgi:Ni,Fe-hydrogenase III large subunit